MTVSQDFLKVEGDKIVLDGKPVVLKGAGMGGWMNMENFITGYPGHEFQVRRELKKVLGEDKYEYFFDKFLEYFFTEDDAKFYVSLGLNCLRLPINYRHFEDDMNPGVFKPEGLKHLDRVIDICAKHKIYTVIDMHAVPGAQNVDWHSDNGTNEPSFWIHKDFQDRAVKTWEALAAHYKNNTWVAGYNPLNEPTDSEHVRLNAYYKRIEKAIRAVDPNHILFLDGNTFGMDFRQFEDPLPNCVYAYHDYSNYGFPNPPEPFTGSPEQVAFHQRQWERKTEYMHKHKVPSWNGEFGPVYYVENDDVPDWQKKNEERYAVLKCQLGIYAKEHASWSIWTYKDIGFQGLVYVSPDTPYMKLLAPFLRKKKEVACDAWGCDDTPVRKVFQPLIDWMSEVAPNITEHYPKTWDAAAEIARVTRQTLMSELMCKEYASYFKGKSKEELHALAESFAFKNCVHRTTLNKILEEDSKNN